MHKKESLKVSLSTFFLVLAIIFIIALGVYIYVIKDKHNSKIKELELESNDLKIVIDSLQEELNVLQNSYDEKEDIQSNQTNTFFSDEQVKNSLSNYLELMVHKNCDSLLEVLTKNGNLNYDPYKDNILDDGTVITSIKFFDYKNAMLNYVSEAEFDKNWYSSIYFSENIDGYLVKVQGGGGLNTYTVNNFVKNSDDSYFAETSYTTEDEETYNENYNFRVKSYNGNCVIDFIESIQ